MDENCDSTPNVMTFAEELDDVADEAGMPPFPSKEELKGMVKKKGATYHDGGGEGGDEAKWRSFRLEFDQPFSGTKPTLKKKVAQKYGSEFEIGTVCGFPDARDECKPFITIKWVTK
jgi:hypothetical protein